MYLRTIGVKGVVARYIHRNNVPYSSKPKKQNKKKIYNLNVKVIKAVILSIWDLPVGVGTVHMSICYDGFPAAIYNQPTIVKLE